MKKQANKTALNSPKTEKVGKAASRVSSSNQNSTKKKQASLKAEPSGRKNKSQSSNDGNEHGLIDLEGWPDVTWP